MKVRNTLCEYNTTCYIDCIYVGTWFEIDIPVIIDETFTKGEIIMKTTKLALTALVLLLGAAQLMADRKLDKNCCQPTPVGGFQSLTRNAVYPTFDRTVKNNGDVILNFFVDESGNVSNIRVAQSGGATFDNSAIQAVKNTKWLPATQNGYPVALTYAVPFRYRSR